MEVVKVLVVEDEEITALDIQSRLQELGYDVPETVNSGEEAISLAKKIKPNLVLMDMHLKGKMDGAMAASTISVQEHIPVVFLTAFNDEETFNRAKLSSPYGYVTKPFETRDLQIAIELALFKRSAELKIAIADQRYRSVMENALCGIILHDLNGIVIDINKEGEKIFGCPKAQIVGSSVMNFLPSSEQEYAATLIQKLTIKKAIGPNQAHIQQPSGNICDVEYTAVCIENENDSFIFSMLLDTTDQNKLRAQNLLSAKLATVGTLAAGIIHEINNPLTYILTNLNFIKDTMQESSFDDLSKPTFFTELKSIINDSVEGAEQINKIVQDIKGFARIDKAEVTTVDLPKVLNAAINIVSAQFKNHAVVEKDFSADIPLVLLQGSKLQQVFMNIIINAAQSMDKNNFEKNIIRVKAYVAENYICVEIGDTGVGIPSDILEKIFEPFFTTKPAGIGTGLGLSICSEIIHEMGGDIEVKSEVNKGTTFSIYLPINLITENASVSNESRVMTDKNILIIDDEPAFLSAMEYVFGKKNHITLIDSGRSAHSLLIENPDKFDIIICDFNMPDVNGEDLFLYLKRANPKLIERMIFVTGFPEEFKLENLGPHLMNPCLTKPFTKKQLIKAIHSILDRNPSVK